MRSVLLDTHALVWWLEAREKLSKRSRDVIGARDTTVLVSSASAWELAIRSKAGKFRSSVLLGSFQAQLETEEFVELPISIDAALRAGSFDGPHKDPFDRMLAAQAQILGVPLVTHDPIFRHYGVSVVW